MAVTVGEALARASFALESQDFALAIRLYRAIVAEKPNNVAAATGLARAYFLAEDWERAWAAFEVRFRLMADPPAATRRGADGKPEPFPRWSSGTPPRRLLVLCEQGLGDTIQFMRFLPRLTAQGVSVTVPVDKKLCRLLAPALPQIGIVRGDGPGQARSIDAWVPLLSIPGLLGLRGEDLCPRMPYLLVEPDRVDRWRRALIVPEGINIGLCWQGNPAHPSDGQRSAPIAALAPLAELPGVRLISLQVDPAARASLASAPFADRIVQPDPSFDAGGDAFLDTAALMTSLDLVITVDTSIAHVAGALGRSTWLALSTPSADWRWLARPHDTPWYPTMRLYRQPAAGDWAAVFGRMADDLRTGAPRAQWPQAS